MASRVVMTGAPAVRHCLVVAGIVEPINQGGYSIPVGTVDREQGMVILGQQSGETYYFMNDLRLLAAPTPEFLQGYFIGQVASDVYRRTAWIIPASRITMGFAMGAAIGFAGALGVVASVVVIMGKMGSVANAHPNEIALARQHLPAVWDHLMWFRTYCPTLYGKLSAVVRRGVIEALLSAPNGIRAEEVAEVIGRILGGALRQPDTGLVVLLGIIAKTVAIYGALHAPLAVAHGLDPDALAQAMLDEIRRQVAVSPAEEAVIRSEIGNAAEVGLRVHSLSEALQRAAPALDRLAAAYLRS